MPQIAFVYTTPLWAIGCALFVLLLLATEVGFQIGVRARAKRKAGDSLDIGPIHGAVLGLLSGTVTALLDSVPEHPGEGVGGHGWSSL